MERVNITIPIRDESQGIFTIKRGAKVLHKTRNKIESERFWNALPLNLRKEVIGAFTPSERG